MKRTFLLQALLGAVLLFGITVCAGRLLGAAGSSARVDLGGRHPATLPVELGRFLRGLDGELAATLFVSGRERMPSHLGDVEETARALLEEMEDAAGGRFSYRVIDPGLSGPPGARYAASRRVSPIRVRRVVDDAESQAEIWSSLVFSRQGRPRREDILIQGIENAHLPHLAGLVTARLTAGESAPQASFALSAPPGYGKFPRYLSQHGPVVEIDVDAGGFIPRDVDILFWLEPRQVTRRHIAELRRFLASGRTAVLAGSAYRASYSEGEEGEVCFRAEATGSAWERLLEPFGLEPVADLLMDRNSGPVTVSAGGEEREVDAPFHLRNLPAFRDFRPFRTPARGGLSFTAASPLRVDPRRVAASGYRAHVAATTTEHAWVRPLPRGEFGLEDLSADLRVPKQNLMVLLTPEDPWAGQLLVLASASPFRDRILEQAGYGHAVFVRDLARSFADPERLVRQRVDRGLPPALPPLSGGARVGWRLAVAGLVPLVWAGLAVRSLRGSVRLVRSRHRRPGGPALAAGGAAAAVVFLALRGPLSGLSWDLTAAGVHTPDDSVVSDLRHRAGRLRAELVVSPRSQLPPEVRAVTDRLRAVLSDAGVEVEARRPVEGRDPGVPAFEVERVRQDTSVTSEIHSGLVLHQDGRSTAIPRLDRHTGAHLDFLLAAALKRLDEGAAPVITVVSDLPRLSPAEAHEDYQKKGLSAPQGVDVYARAKELLRQYGYEVKHVPLREPVFPERPGAVIWFQPRRDSTPVLTWLSRHLARGGRAVVAMQHFNIQQRQYRGTGFGTVHWPQPQFQDFDRYLELFGVEQVREVLMDRSRHHLELDTQVNRTAVREYDPQRVALPFLIRALGANHSRSSPVTSRLGDLLFIWGNRFRVDAGALGEAGLRVQVLATTTEGSWSYDWSGGWLPPEALRGDGGHLPGPQGLAVTLEGRFPAVEAVETEGAGTDLQVVPADGAREGWLLLLGSSEMFKNQRLFSAGFAHDQLLLNAVAMAALGPRMAELQGRASAPARGFPVQGSGARAAWRLAVIGGAPLALALVGLWRWRRPLGRRPGP